MPILIVSYGLEPEIEQQPTGQRATAISLISETSTVYEKIRPAARRARSSIRVIQDISANHIIGSNGETITGTNTNDDL